jgi:hypothetical protein
MIWLSLEVNEDVVDKQKLASLKSLVNYLSGRNELDFVARDMAEAKVKAEKAIDSTEACGFQWNVLHRRYN